MDACQRLTAWDRRHIIFRAAPISEAPHPLVCTELRPCWICWPSANLAASSARLRRRNDGSWRLVHVPTMPGSSEDPRRIAATSSPGNVEGHAEILPCE